MKRVPLTHGMEAVVDDCDYEHVMQWKWRFEREGHRRTGYAVRWRATHGTRTLIKMHRLVAEHSGLAVDRKQIDHVDGNGLNNCRNNLRVATPSQNRANLHRARNNTSGFKGVGWSRHNGRFRAYIGVAGRHLHLGYFDDPQDAARAYNEAALKHYGEYSCLNPV